MSKIFDIQQWQHRFDIPGRGAITVRWPTNEEWVRWSNERTIRVRDGNTDYPNAEACAMRLLALIGVEGDPTQFDGCEAESIINALQDSFAVKEPVLTSAGEVELVVVTPGGECSVTMKVPTVRAVKELRGQLVRRQQVGRAEHVWINLASQGDYFERYFIRQEGYSDLERLEALSAIPILHRAGVVRALNAMLEESITVAVGSGPTLAAVSQTS